MPITEYYYAQVKNVADILKADNVPFCHEED